MAEPVRVLVDGRDFRGWTKVTIRRSVLNVAGGCELELAPKLPLPLRAGSKLEVWYQDHPLLNGHVSAVDVSFDGRSRSMKASGFDKTQDLAESSPDPDMEQEWVNTPLLKIAADVCKPFGIDVTIFSKLTDVGGARVRLGEDLQRPLFAHAIEHGDSAFSVIEKAARGRGALIYCPGDGKLLVSRSGRTSSTVPLAESSNVLSASSHSSKAERFSVYVVRGQQPGTDEVYGAAAASPAGRAIDAAVTRFRPLLVHPETSVDIETATVLARWEARVRAAQSEQVIVSVFGWSQGGLEPKRDTPLWRPNQLVDLWLPSLGVRRQGLIQEATYTRSLEQGGGTTTELVLVAPDAFDPEPEIAEDYDLLRGQFEEGE